MRAYYLFPKEGPSITVSTDRDNLIILDKGGSPLLPRFEVSNLVQQLKELVNYLEEHGSNGKDHKSRLRETKAEGRSSATRAEEDKDDQ